jgi:hypothetical protein
VAVAAIPIAHFSFRTSQHSTKITRRCQAAGESKPA